MSFFSLLFMCVCEESTKRRQTWSLLYHFGISLSTGGRVLDPTDTQVYVCVCVLFLQWKEHRKKSD